MIGVPEGSDIELRLRFEAVLEGVLVSGTARAAVTGECGRCLDPLADGELLEVDLQELFGYPESVREDDDEADLPLLEHDLLDLGPTLRDAVVLALPLTPLCRPDCPGLCAQCGARLADDPDHTHDEIDARWTALTALAGEPDDQDL